MLIDTHSHCYWETIAPDLDSYIEMMSERGVVHAVQIGCDLETSRQAIELADRYPGIFSATVGIHPETAQDMTHESIDTMIEDLSRIIEAKRGVVVAIGETGFDRHYLDPEHSPAQLLAQRYSWDRQIELAYRYDLPVVIHTREARVETIEAIGSSRLHRAIMHCYSEDLEYAREIMDLSDEIYFSFSGILTYPRAEAIRETAKYLPLDRILIETDAPFLAPVPVRGSVNHPANVAHTFETLVRLRGEDREVIEQTLYENSLRVYGLQF